MESPQAFQVRVAAFRITPAGNPKNTLCRRIRMDSAALISCPASSSQESGQQKKARTKSGPFLLCHYYANHYANLCQYAVNLDNIMITPDNTFKGYEPRINTEKNSPCRYMTGAVENVTGLAGFKHKSLILCGFSGFYANYYATRQESHEINRLHLLFFRGIHGMCIKP